jgi:6-phosphogluconolactonase (cycloisomerase 2 family)
VYPLITGTDGSSSTSNPCTASVCLGAPATNNALGTAYWPLTINGSSDIIVPTAVNVVASGAYVFVTAYDCGPICLPPVSPIAGYVYGFSVGTSGALTPIPGSPFAAGTRPTGVASDSSSAYVFVTDSAHNAVLAYTVGSSGALTPLSSSPFATGNQPAAVVVDPVYPYVYVTNALDGTVSAYSMSGGALTNLGTYTVGADPVAIGIDPSTEHFLFTANFLDNTVNGFELSTTAGTLIDSQFSPFTASINPTAVAAIPHNGIGGGIAK